MMATLLLAQGTPMLTAGDEWGRSQDGNNNAYCQDNALSWQDWKQAQTPEGQTLQEVVRRLLSLRRRLYAIGAHRFAHGNHEPMPGIGDIAWFDTDGQPPSPDAWADPEIRTLAMRRAERPEPARRSVRNGQGGPVQVTLLLLNSGDTDAVFRLPEPALDWQLLFDSSQPELPESGRSAAGVTLQAVPAHALVLLAAQAEPQRHARPAIPPRSPPQEPDA
jgi:glycogen operon protein